MNSSIKMMKRNLWCYSWQKIYTENIVGKILKKLHFTDFLLEFKYKNDEKKFVMSHQTKNRPKKNVSKILWTEVKHNHNLTTYDKVKAYWDSHKMSY